MHLSDEKLQKLLFILILILGIGARLWMSGDVPGGINQDEAFAAREAWSLLHYGKDSFGYSCPMYLMAWGSGMSALNTYLMTFRHAYLGLPSATDADWHLIPVCHRRNCGQSIQLEMFLTCHVPFSDQSLAYHAFPMGVGL